MKGGVSNFGIPSALIIVNDHRGNFMKLLILITFSIASLNIFSAELGEDQKSDCKFANQTAKREVKEKDQSATETKKEPVINISK